MRCVLVVAALATPAAASTTITGGNIINQTWTAAGSPYVVEGDITIPDGSTLTIESGVEVDFPGGDLQGAGISTTETEVVVHGALVVHGTAAAPVTFAGASAKAWYGIELAGAMTSEIDHAVLSNADVAVVYAAAGNTISGSGIDIESPAETGVSIQGGAPVFDAVIVRNSGGNGISVGAGSPTFTNCVVANAGRRGIESAGNFSTGPGMVTIVNCTIDHAAAEAVFNFVPLGSPSGTMQITNSLITNSDGGLMGKQLTGSYCDSWNQVGGNFDVGVSCEHCSSQNPQYVSATDLHLQASSVAIDVGTTGPDHDVEGHARPADGDGINGAQWDLGAYEYGSTSSTGGGDAGVGGDAGNGNDGGNGNANGDAGLGGGAGMHGGCCQVGGSGGSSALLAFVVAACLRRRRFPDDEL